MSSDTKFFIGQVVHHKMFDHRGVIVDVDPRFLGTDEWYEAVARSRPPRDRPWYQVLPHDSFHQTYVAERNLDPDETGRPVRHPLLASYFDQFRKGHYVRIRLMN